MSTFLETVYLQELTTGTIFYIKNVTALDINSSMQFSEHPTMYGVSISDHARRQPDNITLSLRISHLNKDSGIYASSAVHVIGNLAKQAIDANAFKILLKTWYLNHTKFNLQTHHDLFTNLVIATKTWDESSNNGTLFEPSITFKELKIATTSSLVGGVMSVLAGAKNLASTALLGSVVVSDAVSSVNGARNAFRS